MQQVWNRWEMRIQFLSEILNLIKQLVNSGLYRRTILKQFLDFRWKGKGRFRLEKDGR